MLLIPSLDIQAGRSRLVWWPGASTGSGVPTDRPERIAEAFVAAGAPVIHLVDQDGARAGRPVNTAAVGAIARAVAVPLQLAGGVDGPEQVELAFAAGATRVVLPLWAVAEDHDVLAACLRIAGDWLAVGLDARSERLRDYPWRGRSAPTLEGLVSELASMGVHRLILSHGGGAPDPTLLARLAASAEAEIVVAGGVGTLDGLLALRQAGVGAVILGEALFTGGIDFSAASAALRVGA
jgi:phosphoribosylformimino-5-aminoimidazole carboxamide ribotide isomerase